MNTRFPLAFAALCAAALSSAGLTACELAIRPDDVPPPGAVDAGGGERADASCTPTRDCVAGNCGTIDDGCGRPLNCGKCVGGKQCQDNLCVATCTAETDAELCAAAGADCGTLSVIDKCGKPRTPSCGGASCPPGMVCGGNAAKPHACACNAGSCTGTTHCDTATGSCVAGCSTAAQCTVTGADCVGGSCVCPGGGHECVGACVPNDQAHCGTGCLACPTDPHGSAGCDGISCSLTCSSGYLDCSGACSACPANGKTFACGAAGKCVANECVNGYSVCDGACCKWQIDTVTSSSAGGRLSIAIDENDVSHIAFWATAKDVRWGKRNATGTWTIETIETTGSMSDDQIVSVGVVPGGEPAVLYLDGRGNVRIGERKKGGTSGWTKSTVYAAASPDVPLAPSLAVQADGTLHAAFGEDGSPYHLYYATRLLTGPTWTQELVDSPDGLGLATAIALDASNKPSLAAMEIAVETNYDDTAYFFARSGASFTPQKIESGALGYSLSMAIGAGFAQVGFARGYLDTLVYATQGTPWLLADVQPNSARDDASLVVDKQGDPHFVYVSSVSGAVRHAYLAAGAWTSDLVDSDAAGVSAAVDKSGRVRIVYRSSTNGAVKHAWLSN